MNWRKILNVVMTHPEAHQVYVRNKKYWDHHGWPTLTYTTADTPKSMYPKEVLAFGACQHHGSASLDRFRYLIRSLANISEERGITHFMVNEYDSFCLTPTVSPLMFGDCIWGNLHHEIPGTKFVGTEWIVPPLFASAKIIRRLADACDKMMDQECGGFWDRWIGHICQQSGIPMMPYGTMGFSVNTIEDATIPSAVDSIRSGAVFLHGVKSQKSFEAIEAAYAQSL